ncbi:MAG: hypothetical protein RMN25_05010 [Anaerolineae bacterium]|nr:hypothetical protein [Thermoflexales bacterium]MDW8407124.1 hypothetical protein [Anaerolineae bacterium]
MTAFAQADPPAGYSSPDQPRGRVRLLIPLAFFLAAFLHANLWGVIIPLWQIPDEAAHYEYVRLLVKLGRPPTPADADPELQAQMLRSMWENHYWEYLGFVRPEQPPKRVLAGGWIAGGAIPDTAVIGDAFVYAFSNLSNSQPVYYALLAPVQAAVIQQPIDEQLRALRLFSRGIFALGVLFIVLTAGELFKWRLLPVVGAGVFSVLQPMFVYIGSGVNNDNGVMLFASAAMWQLAAGWRRGYPWWRIGLIALLCLLALFAKRTGVFLIVWAPLVIGGWALLRMERRRAKRLLLAGAAVTGGTFVVAAALYFIPGPTPANWRSSAPWQRTWTDAVAREGSRSFLLQTATLTGTFRRPFGLADGSPLVVEAWTKSEAGAQGRLTVSTDNGAVVSTSLGAAVDWQPVSVTLSLPPNTSRLFIALSNASAAALHIDSVRAFVQAPQQLVVLPAPNPSAEAALPLLGQIVLEAARPLGVYGQAVRLIQDYRANLAALGERLPTAIAFVQQSFWGKFGIFARAPNPTIDIGWVTLLAMLAGAALGVNIQHIAERRPDRDMAVLHALWLVGLALLTVQTFAPLLSFGAEGTWLPQGRYLFAGMGMIAPLLSGLGKRPAGLVVLAGVLIVLATMMGLRCAEFF